MTKYGKDKNNDARKCAAKKIKVQITKGDLAELLRGSQEKFGNNVNARPGSQLHKVHSGQKPVAIALCQSAAMHYHKGATPYGDFDVFLFYDKSKPRGKEKLHPARNTRRWCYENAKYPCGDIQVDVLVRRIDVVGKNPAEIIRHFLETKPSLTAHHLAESAVVLLHPPAQLGKVIWCEGKPVD